MVNAGMMRTRFAPSPTGRLHLGHAASALFAAKRADAGQFLVRLEDIDGTRCRPEFVAGIYEDLHWLGLQWPQPVLVQSTRFAVYEGALAGLRQQGLLYRCFCTRADIARAGGAPQGDHGPRYPGTCRGLTDQEVEARLATGQPYAWRLSCDAAADVAGEELGWRDLRRGPQNLRVREIGDVVVARKDVPASYHLASVWDDAAQGVTLVTRGEDLFEATPIHRVLQALLGLPVPDYEHHPLLCDANGQRFAKRDHAPTLQAWREAGKTRDELLAMMPDWG